jgi:hypothetical protein
VDLPRFIPKPKSMTAELERAFRIGGGDRGVRLLCRPTQRMLSKWNQNGKPICSDRCIVNTE